MNSGGDSTSGSMSGEDVAVVDSPGTIQFESSTDQPERTAPPTGVILQGDCVELMRALPEESIRMVVTSPPYNIKNSTGNGLKDGRGGKWPSAALQNGYSEHDDCMPHDEYVEWQRECLAGMLRVCGRTAPSSTTTSGGSRTACYRNRHDIVDGFPVRQIIIWQRAGGINFNPGYFLPNYERDLIIAKPEFRLAPKRTHTAACGASSRSMTIRTPRRFPSNWLKDASALSARGSCSTHSSAAAQRP